MLRRLAWAVQKAGYAEVPDVRLVTVIEELEAGGRWDELNGLCVGETCYVDCTNAWDLFTDTVLHEVAHAIANRAAGDEGEHHSHFWGAVYADLYRCYHDLKGGPKLRTRRRVLPNV